MFIQQEGWATGTPSTAVATPERPATPYRRRQCKFTLGKALARAASSGLDTGRSTTFSGSTLRSTGGSTDTDAPTANNVVTSCNISYQAGPSGRSCGVIAGRGYPTAPTEDTTATREREMSREKRILRVTAAALPQGSVCKCHLLLSFSLLSDSCGWMQTCTTLTAAPATGALARHTRTQQDYTPDASAFGQAGRGIFHDGSCRDGGVTETSCGALSVAP